jgi:inhibitor of KinA
MDGQLFASPHFRIAGDCGLLVEYGDTIHPEVNEKVRSMAIVLENDLPPGVVEIMPTYRSIMIVYDPCATTVAALKKILTGLEKHLADIKIFPPRLVKIPVCYGGPLGPDIEYVAAYHHMSAKEVIELHCRPEYLIYMVGFTPGFPFLGGLSPALHTPRLETPRTLVPEGSVGIANDQTGVYPISSPGGWQLIGRTPLKLFSPEVDPPIRYQAGDRIRFYPISVEDYHRLAQEEVK